MKGPRKMPCACRKLVKCLFIMLAFYVGFTSFVGVYVTNNLGSVVTNRLLLLKGDKEELLRGVVEGNLAIENPYSIATSRNDSTIFKNHRNTGSVTNTSAPVKIILYSYMRGGSSFTGELFSRSRDTFYLFEPVEGVYNALYGMDTGMKALDLFYHSDGTKRQIPQFEIDYITASILKLLNCDFHHLPHAFVAQRYMTERVYENTKSYSSCLAPSWLQIAFNAVLHHQEELEAYKCKKFIRPFCPRHFGRSSETSYASRCYTHFHIKPDQDFMKRQQFKDHEECMNETRKRAEQCLGKLIESCRARKVRSFKTVRLSMELIENLLKQDPLLKIVYLVRDPRGVIASRITSKHFAYVSAQKPNQEVKFLCKRMTFDLDMYETLREKYRKNIVLVKYEDVARSAEDKAAFLYQFTRGISVPEDVVASIGQSTHAWYDSGMFGTQRKNATAAAYQWTKTLPQDLRTQITNDCKTVLQRLGYV